MSIKAMLLAGLIIEIVVAGLLLVGLSSVSIQAGADDSVEIQAVSDNSVGLEILPDIGRIYRAALVTPLEAVEDEIQDEEIAEFYHRLLQKYDLGDH